MLTVNCCDQCWHTKSTPCPRLLPCLTDGPLCHDDENCRQRRQTEITALRRGDVAKPAVLVGTGTCGLGAGADKTLEEVQKYAAKNSIELDALEVGCVGLCAAEPLIDVQLPGRARLSFGNVTADQVTGILDGVFAGDPPADYALGQYSKDGLHDWAGIPAVHDHPFFRRQTRMVLPNCGIIAPDSIEEYIASGGYRALAHTIRETTPDEVCQNVLDNGLRGRGGGGFPTGRKWQFARQAPAEQKYLVCNADEGDPGAFMDRAVIEGDPHRLVEGLALAAYAIGASKAYVYIRAEYPLAIRRLEQALQAAREWGLLGPNILDSGLDLDVYVKKGAGAFVCGEETALLHSIEGRRGMPRPRPPYPAVKGLFDQPTIINNVETLANLPAILTDRAASGKTFTEIGTENSKGTKVFAVSGKVNRTGLVEVAMGTSIEDIVTDIAGGVPDGKALKAVQIGGPSGGCIPQEHMGIQIDYESLKTVGAMMGSGGLVVMDEDTCMVDVAKFFMDFIQRESCGKCIPCREGTKRVLEILNRITRPHGSETDDDALRRFKGVMNMQRLAEVIQSTSLCGLGQTAPNPVLTTLRWFKDEYEAHIYERHCPAGACNGLVVYRIDTDACIGCTKCAKKCPVDAIVGDAKKPHYIVEDKCIGCGNCVDACPVNAVFKA